MYINVLLACSMGDFDEDMTEDEAIRLTEILRDLLREYIEETYPGTRYQVNIARHCPSDEHVRVRGEEDEVLECMEAEDELREAVRTLFWTAWEIYQDDEQDAA